MYQIDRQKFGAFVARLRKEKGLTQKDLAATLYISDKAVSKWETGVSLPDVALLIPLSEILGVSVTELLKCQQIPQTTPMDTWQVEDLVRTAVNYSWDPLGRRTPRKKELRHYLICLVLLVLELGLMYYLGFTRFQLQEPLMMISVLCPIFGLYFMVYAPSVLPRYYDDYNIQNFSDGPMRMNIPGVRISNRNWPYIVAVGRVWSMGMMVGYPVLATALRLLFPEYYPMLEKPLLLVLMLGGLFVPLVIVGKKYE